MACVIVVVSGWVATLWIVAWTHLQETDQRLESDRTRLAIEREKTARAQTTWKVTRSSTKEAE